VSKKKLSLKPTSAILAKAGWTVSNCEGNGLDVSDPPLFEAASTKLNKKHLTFSLLKEKSSGLDKPSASLRTARVMGECRCSLGDLLLIAGLRLRLLWLDREPVALALRLLLLVRERWRRDFFRALSRLVRLFFFSLRCLKNTKTHKLLISF